MPLSLFAAGPPGGPPAPDCDDAFAEGRRSTVGLLEEVAEGLREMAEICRHERRPLRAAWCARWAAVVDGIALSLAHDDPDRDGGPSS